ncbi:hypothetical protein M422DRAFT_256295, partial [Sphaerobolus stellatus SS14]
MKDLVLAIPLQRSIIRAILPLVVVEYIGTSVLPVTTDVNPTAYPTRNDDNKSISIISTTPQSSNPPPEIPSAPRKARASYRHNDGFSIPRRTASPTYSVSKVDMTGSKFFNDWFENSDNEIVTGDEMAADYVPKTTSPPSTSIETQPVKLNSDKSYKRFMSGVLEEMPTPERDLIQTRAARIDRDHHRRSDGVKTNSPEIAPRYTRSEKGKGREIPQNITVEPEPLRIRRLDPSVEAQVRADEILAHRIATQEIPDDIIPIQNPSNL